MTDTMSPATDALTILTDDDVKRYKKDKPKKLTGFDHSLAHLSEGQRTQIIDPLDDLMVIRGGWDS